MICLLIVYANSPKDEIHGEVWKNKFISMGGDGKNDFR